MSSQHTDGPLSLVSIPAPMRGLLKKLITVFIKVILACNFCLSATVKFVDAGSAWDNLWPCIRASRPNTNHLFISSWLPTPSKTYWYDFYRIRAASLKELTILTPIQTARGGRLIFYRVRTLFYLKFSRSDRFWLAAGSMVGEKIRRLIEVAVGSSASRTIKEIARLRKLHSFLRAR